MRALASIAVVAVSLAGCAGDVREIGREPFMSPVGTGLITDVQPSASALFLPSGPANRGASIWNGGRADIFSDPRAAKIGDVVTVQIAINDSATFGNATDRSLTSEVDTGFDFKLGVNNKTTELKPQFNSKRGLDYPRPGNDRPVGENSISDRSCRDRCLAKRQYDCQRLTRSSGEL